MTQARSNRLALPLLTVALALALSCGKEPAAEAGGGFQMPPTPVETAVAKRQTVSETLKAVGTIEADETVAIVPEIEGIVASLPFTEGDAIKKGDTIAVIDDAQLQAETARAAAVRDQQKQAHDRIKNIVDKKIGAPQDLDDARAGLKVAEANLRVAETRLAKGRIVAPFDGVVGLRRVSPGAFLHAGDPITELTKIDEVKVLFSVPERYLDRVSAGTKVHITTKAFPDRPVEGQIDLVEPAIDPATRNVGLRARVQNAGGQLRPGMSADVTTVLAERPDALTIPNECVFAEGAEMLVYVVKPDGSVARTALKLGSRLSDVVEVLSGLEEGATVVRTGHQKLFDGAKVAAVGAEPAGAPAAEPAAGGSHATE